jgi:hypothetical protein
VPYPLNGTYPDDGCQVLREDGERTFDRGWRLGDDGDRRTVLVVLLATEYPSLSSLDRLAHEYGLKDELDGAWAVRPLVREGRSWPAMAASKLIEVDPPGAS